MVNKDERFEYVYNDLSRPLMYVHNLRKHIIYLDEFYIQNYDCIHELFVDEIPDYNVE